MDIETKVLDNGKLHYIAFAVLPKSGRVPINLNALDEAGWVEQSAKWFKDDQADLAELLSEAMDVVSGKTVEDEPTFVYKPVPWTIQRRKAYPPLGDQLDMLYKAIKAGDTQFTEFVEAIEAAKAKVPK